MLKSESAILEYALQQEPASTEEVLCYSKRLSHKGHKTVLLSVAARDGVLHIGDFWALEYRYLPKEKQLLFMLPGKEN